MNQNAVGKFKKTKSTSETTILPSGIKSSNVTETTEKVTASSDPSVVFSIETKLQAGGPFVSSSEIKKEPWLEACKKPVDSKDLEKGTESVTVPAGTFETEWARIVNKSADNETDSKSFTTKRSNGYYLLVKSVTKLKAKTFESLTTTELLDTNY